MVALLLQRRMPKEAQPALKMALDAKRYGRVRTNTAFYLPRPCGGALYLPETKVTRAVCVPRAVSSACVHIANTVRDLRNDKQVV